MNAVSSRISLGRGQTGGPPLLVVNIDIEVAEHDDSTSALMLSAPGELPLSM